MLQTRNRSLETRDQERERRKFVSLVSAAFDVALRQFDFVRIDQIRVGDRPEPILRRRRMIENAFRSVKIKNSVLIRFSQNVNVQ